MCLATTMKVVEILSPQKVRVSLNNVSLEVSSLLFPQIQMGEYVLIHAGFIIGKITESEAETNMRIQEELKKVTGQYEHE